MAGPEAAIEARLHGKLGAFELDVDLQAEAAGVTALIGPSGCGKTTLLRCLAGLCRLAGSVTFKGAVWQDAHHFEPAHRRPVGYVFQEASLFPHLSVRQNLTFGLRRAATATTVPFDAAVDLLNLTPLLERSPAKLSGGERQRVAIGRAMLVQPELLLMDEPVSSLDVESKAEIIERLEQIHRSLATPIVYVSHDPFEVARFADRVLAMRDGRIVGSASPVPESQARDELEGLSDKQIKRLALTALMAGLRPPGERA
jgi:molybdate transport system ATP-binding protein